MNIVFLGAPGSGKGTQAQTLAQQKGWQYISSGDLLRRLVSSREPRALQAQAFMDRGDLVPDELMVEILLGSLEAPKAEVPAQAGVLGLHDGLILDGFPRTRHQAEVLDEMMAQRGTRLDAALLIEVRDEEAEKRLVNRSVCASCGQIYHQRHPVCPACGELIEARSDDNAETIRRRLTIYHQQIDPLIEYYREHDLLRSVDGQGNPALIGERIQRALGLPLDPSLEHTAAGCHEEN
ncbi:MAG: adenylate kinase [Coprothermobacterota bacterium]|nr:adenylate kinase [Coprothermobacterota bacterium]